MRIGINFHTTDRYISGVEYYALGLLRGLLRVGGENDYVVFTNQPDLVKTHASGAGNLKVVGIKRLGTRTARILWEQTRLPRLAARHKLDVLHCMSYICPVFKSSARYVVTVHDTIAIDHPGWCKRSNALYYGLFMKPGLRRASRVISVSRSTAADLRRNFGFADSKLRTVYPGIDGIFRPERNPQRLSQVKLRYKLPERYVLYVGNIEPKKNVGTLLRVQEKLGGRGLPHRLVFAGRRSWRSAEQLDEISRQIAAAGVVSVGYVEREDLPSVYAMADVFVFPSLYEGFGFPPLEAMACGTPVVASRRGALEETLGDAALGVEPENVSQIADAVVSVITDAAVRERHVSLGLKQSALFNWERSVGETLAVYKEVAGANA
ncbi:MAG: glycosyltransferase family 4 protein [Phycisphaerales bacterium]|nr:MAG: glycosyltransferase family 4 protein [Phycisphaerales bacterium]